MSAKYDKKFGPMIIGGFTQGYSDISQQDELAFELFFDESVSDDIVAIEEEMRQTRLLKKVCWVKTICYVPELLTTYFLLGKTWFKERKDQQHYYSQMRKGKMSIIDFQTGLMGLSDKYLILKGKENA